MSEAEQVTCDHCGGPVTQNVHGEVWTTYAALQQRVEELEAALRDVDGELWDHGFAADGGMRSTIRAALTPPEQQ